MVRPMNAAEDRVRRASVSRACPAARLEGAASELGRPLWGHVGEDVWQDADVGGSSGHDSGTDGQNGPLSLTSAPVGT
jgi:hypothetical protein